MLLRQTLDTAHKFSPQEFAALSDPLTPELIDECTVTLRKRRLSMKMIVWAVIGMALFRSLHETTGRPYGHSAALWALNSQRCTCAATCGYCAECPRENRQK